VYTIQEVYRNIASNSSRINLVFGLLVVSAYFQMGYAIWLGFKDKSHAIPIVPLMIFFAHDVEHFVNHDYWFHTIANPFFTAGYWTFPVYIVAELVIMYQILRYSRHEVFPGASFIQSIAIFAALQGCAIVVYIWAHAQMNDPLYLAVALGLTQFLSHAFNIPMLLRRGSRKGQSIIFAVNILLGTGILNWFFGMPLFAEQFRTPVHYAMGSIVVLIGVAYLYMLHRAPRYSTQGARSGIS
jgi:hypothetical protein